MEARGVFNLFGALFLVALPSAALQVGVVPAAPGDDTPNEPGCFLRRPKGCPKHPELDSTGWKRAVEAESFGTAKVNRTACEVVAREAMAAVCGTADVEALYLPPGGGAAAEAERPPAEPGCFIRKLKGCPKHPAFGGKGWRRAEHAERFRGAKVNRTACEVFAKAAAEAYCGTAEVEVLFVPPVGQEAPSVEPAGQADQAGEGAPQADATNEVARTAASETPPEQQAETAGAPQADAGNEPPGEAEVAEAPQEGNGQVNDAQSEVTRQSREEASEAERAEAAEPPAAPSPGADLGAAGDAGAAAAGGAAPAAPPPSPPPRPEEDAADAPREDGREAGGVDGVAGATGAEKPAGEDSEEQSWDSHAGASWGGPEDVEAEGGLADVEGPAPAPQVETLETPQSAAPGGGGEERLRRDPGPAAAELGPGPDLPTDFGCFVRTPTGCPNHPSFASLEWKHEDYGERSTRLRANRTVCEVERKMQVAHWCGVEDVEMLFVPALEPGCYVRTPVGCPNHPSFSSTAWKHEVYGENHTGARLNRTACEVSRKVHVVSWCGTEDVHMRFVPPQQASFVAEGDEASGGRAADLKPPEEPGCFVRTPTGCPNHPAFHSIDWKHEEYGERSTAAMVNSTACVVERKMHVAHWCGANDVEAFFVPAVEPVRS